MTIQNVYVVNVRHLDGPVGAIEGHVSTNKPQIIGLLDRWLTEEELAALPPSLGTAKNWETGCFSARFERVDVRIMCAPATVFSSLIGKLLADR